MQFKERMKKDFIEATKECKKVCSYCGKELKIHEKCDCILTNEKHQEFAFGILDFEEDPKLKKKKLVCG